MPDGPHFSVAMADGRPVAVIAPAITAEHQPPAWISHRGVNVPDSYSMFLIDGVPLAGIATTDRAKPATSSVVSFAVVSFAVVDTDEAVVRLITLGGRSLMDPIEKPTGRICRVADPQGAAFEVRQPRHHDSRMDGNERQPDGQDQFG